MLAIDIGGSAGLLCVVILGVILYFGAPLMVDTKAKLLGIDISAASYPSSARRNIYIWIHRGLGVIFMVIGVAMLIATN